MYFIAQSSILERVMIFSFSAFTDPAENYFTNWKDDEG